MIDADNVPPTERNLKKMKEICDIGQFTPETAYIASNSLALLSGWALFLKQLNSKISVEMHLVPCTKDAADRALISRMSSV
jgi:hypothetical protein